MFEFFDAIILLLSRSLEILALIPKGLAYMSGFTVYITAFSSYISEPLYVYIATLLTISLTLGLIIGILK